MKSEIEKENRERKKEREQNSSRAQTLDSAPPHIPVGPADQPCSWLIRALAGGPCTPEVSPCAHHCEWGPFASPFITTHSCLRLTDVCVPWAGCFFFPSSTCPRCRVHTGFSTIGSSPLTRVPLPT